MAVHCETPLLPSSGLLPVIPQQAVILASWKRRYPDGKETMMLRLQYAVPAVRDNYAMQMNLDVETIWAESVDYTTVREDRARDAPEMARNTSYCESISCSPWRSGCVSSPKQSSPIGSSCSVSSCAPGSSLTCAPSGSSCAYNS